MGHMNTVQHWRRWMCSRALGQGAPQAAPQATDRDARIEDQQVQLKYISTLEMAADIATKGLDEATQRRFGPL